MVGWIDTTRRANPDFLSTQDLESGETNFPRFLVNGAPAIPGASGRLICPIFAARRSETINTIRVINANAAGATPTLVRVGVWEWDDAADNGPLIASTANDTSLFSVANTQYDIPLIAPWSKVKGRRYAIGCLVVTAAALPSIYGYSYGGNIVPLGTLMTLLPRLSTRQDSLTDLPATLSFSTVGGVPHTPLFTMLP